MEESTDKAQEVIWTSFLKGEMAFLNLYAWDATRSELQCVKPNPRLIQKPFRMKLGIVVVLDV